MYSNKISLLFSLATIATAIFIGSIFLSACGQKGPLYEPPPEHSQMNNQQAN
jgi:predicted small lipoprotein YifL